MFGLNDLLELCINLDDKLLSDCSNQHIRRHLDLIEAKYKYPVPVFQDGLDWLNVSEPLSYNGDLKGKLVVLDFFTYCCINCMHILPHLEALEQMFSIEDGVVIIGVHSAKFDNEKVLANILSAVLRYNIHHPVVNDRNCDLWKQFQLTCWPTLIIVGPEGQFLYEFVGEAHMHQLLDFISVTKQYYAEKGLLSSHAITLSLEAAPERILNFPGKVCISDDGNTLVVADTGHHRLLVMNSNGIVNNVIGCGISGYKDGTFAEAQFNSPQGVCICRTTIYIADTNNHVIRKADLSTREVTSLVHNVYQSHDNVESQKYIQQELSSPWDLCLIDGLNNQAKSLLLIAMAGTHQIWVYFLQDSTWYKNRSYKAGDCIRFAGNGTEENRNNSYPEKAGFAQPSGIYWSKKQNCLFVADSESSTVRCIHMKDGAVKNVVGGDIDPQNLFAYGDVDGIALEAKLQHPLGVALVTEDGPLLVADTYNHKIKCIDIPMRSCQTIVGSGKAGSGKGENLTQWQLNEPGGLCCDKKNKRVYIADTNNHDIKVIEWESRRISSLPVISMKLEECQGDIMNQIKKGSNDDGVTVRLQIHLADGIHLNNEAPNSWTLSSEDQKAQEYLASSARKLTGDLRPDHAQDLVILPSVHTLEPEAVELQLKLGLFICEDSGVCRMDKKLLKGQLDKKCTLNEIVFNLNVE